MRDFTLILTILTFVFLFIVLPIFITIERNTKRELYINDKFICNGTYNGEVFFCDDKRNYHNLNNFYIKDK